jgi:hypothetical protein
MSSSLLQTVAVVSHALDLIRLTGTQQVKELQLPQRLHDVNSE